MVLGAAPAQPGQERAAGQPAQPGEERWIDAEAAEAAGYTLVDLSDDWTPYIFAEQAGPDGQPLPNRYRRIFVGLANDQLDEDGEPLPPGAKNYLELYGIFPVAVGAARALPRRRAAPLPRSGERRRARRGRDGHLRRARRHQEGRAPAGAHPRGAGGGAQRKAHVATLDELAEKQPSVRRQGEAARASAPPRSRPWPRSRSASPARGCSAPRPHQAPPAGHLRRRHAAGGPPLPAEAHDLRGELPAPQDGRRAGAPLLDNDYDALVRALRERVVSARRRSSRTARRSEGRATWSTSTPRRRWTSCGSTTPPRRWPSSSATRRRRVQDAARGGQAAAASRLLRATTWTSRSSSIAATSGTTSVRRQGPLQAAAAQEVPVADAVREGGRQAGAAGALAHDHRRLARRAGQRTATSTSATRGPTSARA